MPNPPTRHRSSPPSTAFDRFFEESPDYALMGPYFLYLALLAPVGSEWIPKDWIWLAHVLRGVIPLLFVWRIRAHLPPLGKPHVLLAIIAGLFSAALWVAGQHWFDSLGIPPHLPGYPGSAKLSEDANPFNL